MDEYRPNRKRFKLPVVPDVPRERLVAIQTPAHADFVSQLLADRQHLTPQRERRRAQVGQAVDAYANGSKISVRRMPAGYRRTIVT